jgi:hypothetical protein
MIFIIKNSIDSLIKALDGLLSMSNELDDVIICKKICKAINDNKVP